MIRRLAAVTLLAASMAALSPAVAHAGPCGYQVEPVAAPKIAVASWAHRLLDLPRVHRLATGAGVRVAVVDSGTDRRHPQLAKAVRAGWDVPAGRSGGTLDCHRQGHGTAIASLIGARPAAGASLVGVAPRATLLPVRVADNDPATDAPVSAAALATAVAEATRMGADVIHVSYSVAVDDARLRAAVARAVESGAVVVAAAGDGRAGPSYPAAYDGVVGVGALAASGGLLDGSARGPHVDLVAPGEQLVAAARVGGHTVVGRTPAAAAVVSGTAALLRERHPRWTNEEVVRRLLATADGTAGGAANAAFGHGSVNPYRALVEPAATAGAAPTWVAVPGALAQTPARPGWPGPWRAAVTWAVLLGLGAVALLLGRAVARVRSRRHRPLG
ncbi:S8 family serine peptidase [Micromonospora sp. NPDC004336]